MKGAEALCRWTDERWGAVSPVEFIALAEERGLIRELGDWVVRTTTQQLREWLDAGFEFPGVLAINVSAQQLDSPYLVDYFIKSTQDIPSHHLGIEVTESVMMRSPERAMRLLQKLQDRGISIAIDDFGTGYSSLSYLSRFPVNTLKIDRSFVSKLPDDAHNTSLVSTILAMAKNLKLTAVAEGVETQAQADMLKELGCQYVQGFMYGKPLPADVFSQTWLKRKAS